ncbi:hypothetical protein MKEN_00158700 [Mycena kentingensis (nom. inval.)]|nr:hypothetical protein MKEN_00158700 [Mycena kentingensis (nom. inval.)]
MDLPTHSHYPPPSEDVLRRFWAKIRIVRDAVTGPGSESTGSDWAARAEEWNASSSASDCAVCSAAQRLSVVVRGQLACQLCQRRGRAQAQRSCTRVLHFLFDATKDDFFSDFYQFIAVYLDRAPTEDGPLQKPGSAKRHREGNDICQPITASSAQACATRLVSFPMPPVNDAALQAPRKRPKVTSRVIEIMHSDEEELPASITLASARPAPRARPTVIDLRSPSPEQALASDPLDQLHYLQSQNALTLPRGTRSAESRASSTPARATPPVAGSSMRMTVADLLAPSPKPTTLPVSGTRYGPPGPSARRKMAPALPPPAFTSSIASTSTRLGAAPMSCLLPPGMDAPRGYNTSTGPRSTTATSTSSAPSEALPTRPPSPSSSDIEILDAPPASATVDVRCGDTNFKKYQQIVLNHSGRSYPYTQDTNNEEEAFKHSLGQLAVQMANHWCPKNPFADKQSKLAMMGRCKYVAKIPRVCLEKERAAREAGERVRDLDAFIR